MTVMKFSIGVVGDPNPVSVNLLFPGVPTGLCAAIRSGCRFINHRCWCPLLLPLHLLEEQTTVVHI